MKNTDENDAVRKRVNYRGENMYLLINLDDDGILESIDLIQTTDKYDNMVTISGLEFVAGLINMMVQCGKVDSVMGLAERTTLGSQTLPGIIARELQPYI